MLKHKRIVLVCGLLMAHSLYAEPVRRVAITIDDLPFVAANHSKPGDVRRGNERLLKIIETLEAYKVPATGFVIGGAIAKDQWPLLEKFHQDGFIIGNHTYTHPSLNSMSAAAYIAEIAKTDKILTPLMTGKKYFRYPYLAESQGDKKQQVLNYLNQTGYIIAPVTIDSKDFEFNAKLLAVNWRNRMQALPKIKQRYLDFMWKETVKAQARMAKYGDNPPAQILLIHANLLNSESLGDVLAMFQNNGYQFVSLQEALNSAQLATSRNKKNLVSFQASQPKKSSALPSIEIEDSFIKR